jgi:predicted metal-dependent hydrolase
MSKADEAVYVADVVAKLERKYRSRHVDLEARAAQLARRYRLPHARSIRWADNQRSRWGSCSIASADIRISTRLADLPSWVLDYVIVHELVHLVEARHGPEFDAIVARYPKAERAIGYLLAKDLDDEPVDADVRELPVEEVLDVPTTVPEPRAPAPRLFEL